MVCKWQAFQLSGHIHKLVRKWRVVNMTPGMHSQHIIFFMTYKRPNKLECYITLSLNILQMTSFLSLWAHSLDAKKWSVLETTLGVNYIKALNKHLHWINLFRETKFFYSFKEQHSFKIRTDWRGRYFTTPVKSA